MIDELQFDEASHTYTVAGVRLPSVTQLLKPIAPDFSMVPRDVLEAKRAFGVAVHLACEYDEAGDLDDAATDPRVMGCVRAWRSFKSAVAAEVIATEQRLYHPTLQFAGTLDRLVRMSLGARGTNAKPLWLVDLKTSAEAHHSYGVQLAGYRLLVQAADPLTETPRRATVHLSDDGTYKVEIYSGDDDERAFLACLTLHHWRAARGIA